MTGKKPCSFLELSTPPSEPFIKEYPNVDPATWSLYDTSNGPYSWAKLGSSISTQSEWKCWGFVTSEFSDLVNTYIKSDSSLHTERFPIGGTLVTVYQSRAWKNE